MDPIRIGAVSYLNTQPFVYGLTHAPNRPEVLVSADYPSAIAAQLEKKEIDIGLIPVAAIERIPHAKIITDFCIGATGAVASVAIFSQEPLERVTHLLLDYQSKTSVALARLLLQKYWKLSPKLEEASGADFINRIHGSTAAVVIGDRALDLYNKYPFRYDLAEAWRDMTGFPFVFATWVTHRDLPKEFIIGFKQALGWGVDHWQQ
ncbi:MAG: menaquinone biosynthetic enzyme MqnA/MqnD family protein, partial [Sediminibacterium sp.]